MGTTKNETVELFLAEKVHMSGKNRVMLAESAFFQNALENHQGLISPCHTPI